ncbi:MAG: O-antigen ligase family protein [Clostridia bacterium]
MTYFQTVIYMVCLLAIVRYDKNLFYLEFLIICTAFFVSLIVLSGVSSISSALAGREDMFKNSITKVNPNSVGLLQSAAFLFQVIWLKKLRRNRHNIQRRRYLWLMIMVMFLMVMTLLVILISGSRKSMLAAVLTLVMMFIFSPKGKLFHKLMGITLSLVLIVAVFQIGQVFFNKVYIFRRFATFFNETSNTTRVNMIKEGFQLLGTSPFIGVGLGNYTYASSFGTYSHNTVAEALATTGLLGAIIYFSTYLIIFSKLVLFTKHPKTKEFAYNGIILFGVLAFLSIGVIHFYEILSSLLFTYLIAGLVIYKDNVRYS